MTRKAGNSAKKVVLKTTIRIFNDGSVKVDGFPTHLERALNLVNVFNQTIVNKFVDAAEQNQLNENREIDGSRIVVPTNAMVVQ